MNGIAVPDGSAGGSLWEHGLGVCHPGAFLGPTWKKMTVLTTWSCPRSQISCMHE